ncbi:hypothetical protein [Acidocella sp.]|jgi:hypothetical protein|uniref:hypothetical protein n=1 Tax=Acidocella sp. TaxID=50710 RepID=UPI002F3EF990
MGWVRDWLETVNNGLSVGVALGLPIGGVVSAGAGIWAYVRHGSFLFLGVTALLVFALSLWSWIGVVWLIDRAKRTKKDYDCAWGMAVDAAFVGLDPPGAIIEIQVSLQLRNTLAWPLRYEIVSQSIEINNMLPDIQTSMPAPSIVAAGRDISVNFAGYSHGRVNLKNSFAGNARLTLRYGHPESGFSREMSRSYSFHLNSPQGQLSKLAGMTPPMSHKLTLLFTPKEQDDDKPTKVRR